MPLNMSNFEDLVTQHMRYQPYRIVCATCRNELEVDTKVDGDFDLHIEVQLCDHCRTRGGE